MTTTNLNHPIVIPDSLLTKEATELLREHSTDLLFNHSMRVYLFAAEQGRQREGLRQPALVAHPRAHAHILRPFYIWLLMSLSKTRSPNHLRTPIISLAYLPAA